MALASPATQATVMAGTLDVLFFRAYFQEFMAEHGHEQELDPSLDEIERVLTESRYLA